MLTHGHVWAYKVATTLYQCGPILRPWIRSADVRGERHYENWKTLTRYQCGYNLVATLYVHTDTYECSYKTINMEENDYKLISNDQALSKIVLHIRKSET